MSAIRDTLAAAVSETQSLGDLPDGDHTHKGLSQRTPDADLASHGVGHPTVNQPGFTDRYATRCRFVRTLTS